MPLGKTVDTFFAEGYFLDPADSVLRITVFTGKRPDEITGKAIGHYIIEVAGDDIIHWEMPIGLRHIRYPSVSGDIREPWYIAADGLTIGFGPTPAKYIETHINYLAIGKTVLRPVPDVTLTL